MQITEAATPTAPAPPAPAARATGYLYYRHTLPVRIMHWTNAIALTLLLMSGLQIFNAHPALYWGKSSYTGRPAFLEMTARQSPEGGVVGVTRVFGHEFVTTGVFGASPNAAGEITPRGFPSWLTIPDNQWLSMARLWHFFFAWVLVVNGLVYVL